MNILLAYLTIGLVVFAVKMIVSPSLLHKFSDTINRHRDAPKTYVVLGVMIAIIFVAFCYPCLVCLWAIRWLKGGEKIK